MPNIVIVGAQWGDEGKGKVVDLLTPRVQVVARYNGGHNAGHTVIVGGKKFILHVIPSGILHPGVLCVAGNGMVINPAAFEREKTELEELGVEVGEDLVISDRVHLILPHHYALEALSEEQRGSRALGTTLRGTGPAYEDKVGRRGVTMGDLPASRLPRREAGRGTAALRGPLPRGGAGARGRLGACHRRSRGLRGAAPEPDQGRVARTSRADGPGVLDPLRGGTGHSPRRRPRHLPLRDELVGDGGRGGGRSRGATRRASTASWAWPRPTARGSEPGPSRARPRRPRRRPCAPGGRSTGRRPAGLDAAAGSTQSRHDTRRG